MKNHPAEAFKVTLYIYESIDTKNILVLKKKYAWVIQIQNMFGDLPLLYNVVVHCCTMSLRGWRWFMRFI